MWQRFGALFLLWGACWWHAIGACAAEVVVFDDGSPPIMYADPAGMARGIYPAIVARAFERMNTPLEVRAWPFKRVIGALKTGQVGVGGLIFTREREKIADYSRPYITEVIRAYARPSAGRAADLKGLIVGVRRGWSYGSDFDAARARGDFLAMEFGLDQQGFEMLALGRIDRMLSTEWTAAVLMRDPRLSSLRASESVVMNFDIHLAFSKGMHKTALLRAFDQAVEEMRRSGEIDRLVQQEIARAATLLAQEAANSRPAVPKPLK